MFVEGMDDTFSDTGTCAHAERSPRLDMQQRLRAAIVAPPDPHMLGNQYRRSPSPCREKAHPIITFLHALNNIGVRCSGAHDLLEFAVMSYERVGRVNGGVNGRRKQRKGGR